MPKLPSDTDLFIEGLLEDVDDGKPIPPLESLVHPLMKSFLAGKGLNDPMVLVEQLADQLNTFISALAEPRNGEWDYLVSPLQICLIKAMGVEMLDMISQNPEQPMWIVSMGPDGNLYATMHYRVLFLFLAMYGTLLMAGQNQIGPEFEPTTASIPAITATLADAALGVVAANRTGMEDLQKLAAVELEDALTLYQSLYKNGGNCPNDGPAPAF